MTALDRQVAVAQARLNTNILLHWVCTGVVVAAISWALIWTAQRLFALGVPLWPSVAGAGAFAVLIAMAGLLWQRVGRLQAAVQLDKAAGLKERVSTALEVRNTQDPFVMAAIRDAEAAASRIHVAAHLPLRTPPLLSWSIATLLAAALLGFFLPQMNLLASDKPGTDREAQKRQQQERAEIKARVDEKLDRIREFAKENPQLGDLAKELQPLALPEKSTQMPDDVRREALKQIDKVSDKLEQKLETPEMASLDDFKKMLAKMDQQIGEKQQSTRLEKALQEGDMAAARKAIEEVKQEILAAAKQADPQAKQKLEELSNQLESTAKKMSEAADSKALEKELQNKGGLTEEQAKKLLNELKNMDPQQLKKTLEEQLKQSGMTPQQLQDLAKKISENKQAQEQIKKMAQQMAQAAQACKNAAQQEGAATEDAAQQAGQSMDSAAEQMSEMEMAEQMMNELEMQLQDLKDLRAGVCQGQNGGMGDDKSNEDVGGQGPQYGLGYGARIGKEKAAHNLTPSKVRGVQNKGEIIGQTLVDGPQLRGEARAAVREAVQSAVRDATDAVTRQQVPKQYSRAVREYFEQLAGLVGDESVENSDSAAKENAPKPSSDK